MAKNSVRVEICNLRYEKMDREGDVRCDRRTPFGNQFIIGRDGDREEVVRKHRRWLMKNIGVVTALSARKPKRLFCWCVPELCHCHNYAEALAGDLWRKFDPDRMMGVGVRNE